MAENSEITASNIVMPAVTPDQAVDAWQAYQNLKKRIADKNDIQYIGKEKFYKKSYWRKVATFFNLSVEIVEEDKDEIYVPSADDPEIKVLNNIVFYFTCKATAPNGRYAIGTGSCDLLEKGRRNSIHNARSTAETRAFNRAVSNLVGGGEVSAEEMEADQPVGIKHGNTSNKPCPICHAPAGKPHASNCPNA